MGNRNNITGHYTLTEACSMLIEAMIGKKYFDRAEELLQAAKFEGDDNCVK